jgi:sucrose-6-phosphate hydrolase SacC (GH32 family)
LSQIHFADLKKLTFFDARVDLVVEQPRVVDFGAAVYAAQSLLGSLEKKDLGWMNMAHLG